MKLQRIRKNLKSILFISLIAILCISCEKEEFDINHPDVAQFVKQIKAGTYNYYEKGENGEDLWLQMPEFTKNHIPALIEYSKDTTHITNFPFNPVSSRTPFPAGRDYCILGECLLWTVEGIRNDLGYGSLDPYLFDISLSESERYKGLNGTKIVMVRDIYKEWWNYYKDADWQNKNPLENTTYRWF